MPQRQPADPRGKRLSIHCDRLLLVEGRDEVNLFCELIRHCLGKNAGIQVIEAGGKYQFPKRLKAIQELLRIRPSFRSFGVVRDGGHHPENAFRSVCTQLHNTGYVAPESHGTFSNGTPPVGVFIMPDGSAHGALETLCRRSVADTDAAQCVEQYLECLKDHKAMESDNIDKSFAHAYLASTQDPLARVGEGALRGVWDFDAPAFRELRCFISGL